MAKTIHTILYDDVLDGSKIVTMDNCVCQLFDIKRDFDTLIRDEKDVLSKPALYILLNRENRKAYIGETDDFLQRGNTVPGTVLLWLGIIRWRYYALV